MEADILAMVLNISSNEQFHQILQSAVNELVGKKVVSHENINNEVDWSPENQSAARKFFQNVFVNAAFDENNKLSDLDIGEEKLKIVEDVFNIRKSEILNKLQCDVLSKLNDPLVTAFDWKLKWLIGSSSLSSIREPVAQIDLYTLKNKENVDIKNIINFEMNLTELDSLITQLDGAINNLNENCM